MPPQATAKAKNSSTLRPSGRHSSDGLPTNSATHPKIDYDVPVTIDFCSHTGTLGGKHDGYPSYMAFVNGKKVYDFNQTTHMVGPINLGVIKLLPPMDVSPNVSFFW